MKISILLLQNAIRLIGVVLIVLGFLFWTGHEYQLVTLHMRLGETLVLLLWIIAVLGLLAHIKPVLPIIAICWGLLTVWFGMRMGTMVPGAAHEVIRVLHFIIGLCAIGLAESIGARVKRTLAA